MNIYTIEMEKYTIQIENNTKQMKFIPNGKL